MNWRKLMGLLNTPMNQGGGLLGNIPQGALLGAALYGQGIQGKDPLAGLFPAYMQTAQLQKLMTPDKTNLQKSEQKQNQIHVRLKSVLGEDVFETKSDKKLVPSPNYGANIAFNGESETLLMINGEYPKVLFYSEGSSGFTGAWTVEIKMTDVMASSGSEQIWDSEELTFEDKNNRVIVAAPPDLQMISFSSSSQGPPIREGTAVELKMEVSNVGEATD